MLNMLQKKVKKDWRNNGVDGMRKKNLLATHGTRRGWSRRGGGSGRTAERRSGGLGSEGGCRCTRSGCGGDVRARWQAGAARCGGAKRARCGGTQGAWRRRPKVCCRFCGGGRGCGRARALQGGDFGLCILELLLHGLTRLGLLDRGSLEIAHLLKHMGHHGLELGARLRLTDDPLMQGLYLGFGFAHLALIGLADAHFLLDTVIEHFLLLVDEEGHILHGLLKRDPHRCFFIETVFQVVEAARHGVHLPAVDVATQTNEAHQRIPERLAGLVTSPDGLDLGRGCGAQHVAMHQVLLLAVGERQKDRGGLDRGFLVIQLVVIAFVAARPGVGARATLDDGERRLDVFLCKFDQHNAVACCAATADAVGVQLGLAAEHRQAVRAVARGGARVGFA